MCVPGWPGEAATAAEARRDPGLPPDLGLAALTAYYAEVVESFDIPPVLIGHSAGGLIAQQLLTADLGQAAVALAPLPVEGDPVTGLRPRPCSPSVAVADDEQALVSLTRARFRCAVGNAVGEDEADVLFEEYAVPAPRRLLVDLGFDPEAAPIGSSAAAPHPAGSTARGPLLLVSGQEDRMVEDAATRAVYRLYGDLVAVTDLKQFADRGHSLVFDSGWRAVADHVLAWLAGNGSGAVTRG